MTTFTEIRDGEIFVRNGLIYKKIPPINTPIGKCEACSIGINAVAIGRQDGGPPADFSGLPLLPWYVHFCPSEEVERFSLQHWLEKAREALQH